MKTAIAFLTKDRCELSRQTIRPLLTSGCDVIWIDGSDTEEGQNLPAQYDVKHVFGNVKGGAGAAIVFALTRMLELEENYGWIGLCENDTLLPDKWRGVCRDCVACGVRDGLAVGAVSARTYEDRILLQRDGYAVMHNLGAGHILLSRAAARIVLNTFRTAWTLDNRRIFARLSGIDIGGTWAFRGGAHYLTADWHWEATLAAHGLAAVAPTPSFVTMIGQDPPLVEQGLALACGPVEVRRDDEAFSFFATRTAEIRDGQNLGIDTQFHFTPEAATWTIFPHQIHMIGGRYEGDWRVKETRGFGTFGAQTATVLREFYAGHGNVGEEPTCVRIPLCGPVSILVGGGKTSGKFQIKDESSGFVVAPDLIPEQETVQILSVAVPGGFERRTISITTLAPGGVFYGVQTREPQVRIGDATFDYSRLP